MSSRWLTGWLDADIKLRLLSAIGAGTLVSLLVWQFWLSPVQQASQRLDRQMQEQSFRYQQHLESLRRLPPRYQLEQQIKALGEQTVARQGARFSLPLLLAASGGELEHWQPGDSGGELAIRLQWQQFTALLGYLMTLSPAVTIPSMTLQGQSPRLHLLIQLHYEI